MVTLVGWLVQGLVVAIGGILGRKLWKRTTHTEAMVDQHAAELEQVKQQQTREV